MDRRTEAGGRKRFKVSRYVMTERGWMGDRGEAVRDAQTLGNDPGEGGLSGRE